MGDLKYYKGLAMEAYGELVLNHNTSCLWMVEGDDESSESTDGGGSRKSSFDITEVTSTTPHASDCSFQIFSDAIPLGGLLLEIQEENTSTSHRNYYKPREELEDYTQEVMDIDEAIDGVSSALVSTIARVVEGRNKRQVEPAWPPIALTHTMAMVVVVQHQHALLPELEPMLQEWLQCFCPLPPSDRRSVWEDARGGSGVVGGGAGGLAVLGFGEDNDPEVVAERWRHRKLVVALVTIFFQMHVVWPLLGKMEKDGDGGDGISLMLDWGYPESFLTECFTGNSTTAVAAANTTLRSPPRQWSEDEALIWMDMYGAYLDLDRTATACAARGYKRAVGRVVGDLANSHPGFLDARDELESIILPVLRAGDGITATSILAEVVRFLGAAESRFCLLQVVLPKLLNVSSLSPETSPVPTAPLLLYARLSALSFPKIRPWQVKSFVFSYPLPATEGTTATTTTTDLPSIPAHACWGTYLLYLLGSGSEDAPWSTIESGGIKVEMDRERAESLRSDATFLCDLVNSALILGLSAASHGGSHGTAHEWWLDRAGMVLDEVSDGMQAKFITPLLQVLRRHAYWKGILRMAERVVAALVLEPKDGSVVVDAVADILIEACKADGSLLPILLQSEEEAEDVRMKGVTLSLLFAVFSGLGRLNEAVGAIMKSLPPSASPTNTTASTLLLRIGHSLLSAVGASTSMQVFSSVNPPLTLPINFYRSLLLAHYRSRSLSSLCTDVVVNLKASLWHKGEGGGGMMGLVTSLAGMEMAEKMRERLDGRYAPNPFDDDDEEEGMNNGLSSSSNKKGLSRKKGVDWSNDPIIGGGGRGVVVAGEESACGVCGKGASPSPCNTSGTISAARSPVEEEEVVVMMGCGHTFHASCLQGSGMEHHYDYQKHEACIVCYCQNLQPF